MNPEDLPPELVTLTAPANASATPSACWRPASAWATIIARWRLDPSLT